jgi:membrane associated rhomboid family serine protease
MTLCRREPQAALRGLVSAALITASLAVFFIWIFPANQATGNWTTIPDNWEVLRRHWEYAHAASALIVFAAFLATVMATVSPEHHPSSSCGL